MKYLSLVLPFLFISMLFGGCSTQNTTQPTVTIKTKTFSVELADTPETRVQGLSGRTSLPINHGMLFVFPNRDYHSIWMKDMRFPIDIIWIDETRIMDVVENAPPPVNGTLDSQLPVYKPTVPATHVLELPAGSVQKYTIEKGENIIISERNDFG